MAFGSTHSEDGSPMSEINVTPLVDVMLVLLIVFMITMPVLTHSIPIQLPTASEQVEPSDKPKDLLQLEIDANGQYHLGGQAVSENELSAKLKNAYATNPDTVLAIDADKEVAYNEVVRALEMAKLAGLTKVGFNTEVKM